jgi:ribose-phosphate pyrophosphokinase
MPGISTKPITILASEPMEAMGRSICDGLNQKEETSNMARFVQVALKHFANNEYVATVLETIRHTDVYFLHSLHDPDPCTSLVQLLITNDALKRASARSITPVLPYMSFMRQDRKAEERVPITAKLIFDLIETNRNVKHILTLDLHSEQEQGFADGPVDNLTALKIHAKYFMEKHAELLPKIAVLSPDFGRSKYVKRFAKYLEKHTGLQIPVIICDKDRLEANQSNFAGIIGSEYVRGRVILMCDDMVDTGGSVLPLVDMLEKLGAERLFMFFTHGVLSLKDGVSAESRLRSTGAQVIITNSIPRAIAYQDEHRDWLTILPLEELLTQAIYESFIPGGSISKINSH